MSLRLSMLAVLVRLGLRAARLPAAPRLTLAERLRNVPLAGAPLAAPVQIAWDGHAVPFVTARNLPDLAIGLGIVHAHLRLGQLEIMRRLALGRIAQTIGPAGLEVDIALRCLDLARAAPAILAAMPDETRVWAEAFLAGLNHVIAHAPDLPVEYKLFGLAREPWTMTDLLALLRLTCADITWMPALKLLRAREAMDKAEWQALWPDLRDGALPLPQGPLAAFARGSNSAAISAGRSAAGAAMIASDPHVGLLLPSTWLLCGMSAPGVCASGLMIPGVPAIAIGRNRHIAWGATNLHAASSVFVDLDAEPDPQIRPREVEIAVRGAAPRRITLRESRFGPVLSDCKLLGLKRPTALAWAGHRSSDELTALLRINRAPDFEAFRDALKGFGVQGYSFTYADRAGRTGIVRAAHVPARSKKPGDLTEPGAAADDFVSLAETEAVFDPLAQFVVSANEDIGSKITAGLFYSPPDRAERLKTLLTREAVTRADMQALQRDVFAPSALAARDALAARAAALNIALPPALLAWDGQYDEASRGALAYEILLGETARRVIGEKNLAPLLAAWTGRGVIIAKLLAAPDARLAPALARAARRAGRVKRGWGEAHRLRLAHPLARLPGAGRAFGRLAFPVPGSNDTVYKMGHLPLRTRGGGRHFVSYGASARHVADFAAADEHFAVLLGGQDGWPGSANASDQVALWRAGRYVTLPMRPRQEPGCVLTELTPALDPGANKP